MSMAGPHPGRGFDIGIWAVAMLIGLSNEEETRYSL
jgi:hypothetical protein